MRSGSGVMPDSLTIIPPNFPEDAILNFFLLRVIPAARMAVMTFLILSINSCSSRACISRSSTNLMVNSLQLAIAESLLIRNSSEEFANPIGLERYLYFPLGNKKVVNSLEWVLNGT